MDPTTGDTWAIVNRKALREKLLEHQPFGTVHLTKEERDYLIAAMDSHERQEDPRRIAVAFKEVMVGIQRQAAQKHQAVFLNYSEQSELEAKANTPGGSGKYDVADEPSRDDMDYYQLPSGDDKP